MFSQFSALGIVHKILKIHIKPGDFCIDATSGNGHDSVYLCEMNGEQTNIGRSANEIVDFQIRDAEGKDVTDKYKVNIVAGTLRVTRPQ
jgi:hypothetical protein